MSKKPLTLSLVIPVYNEQDHLKKCLDAAVAQLHKFNQIIVVDNNSTDHTLAIVGRYLSIQIHNEAQQGVLFAARSGFNVAQCDIICRIDADTILPPNWARNVHDFFDSHPDIAAVTGNCYFYDFPFKHLVQKLHHAIYYSLQKSIAGTEVLWGSNMAMRNTAWKEVRSDCKSHTDIHEDIDLSLHLSSHNLRIRRVPAMLVGVSLRMMGVTATLPGEKARKTNFSPKILVNYLKPWPHTYWVNKYYFKAVLITIVLLTILTVAIPIICIIWLYKSMITS